MNRVSCMLTAVCLAGCGPSTDQPSSETWTENVQLASGETLVVQRESRFGFGDEAQSGGPLTYSRLQFTYDGKKYDWMSDSVSPDLVEIDDQGRPVVAGSIVYEWALQKRGNPCDQDVVNVSNEGSWVQIPSWTINVSKRRNLASDKKMASEGKSVSDMLGVGGPEVKYEWNKMNCEKGTDMNISK